MTESMTGPEEQSILADDLDDVIKLASQHKEATVEERLSLAQVDQIAEELGIEPEHVGEAIETLQQRRETSANQQRSARMARRKWGRVTAIVAGCLLGLALLAYSLLSSRLSAVEGARSQVKNVVERQLATESTYRERPPSPERDAELDGAANRVRVERRAYDLAARRYNDSASSVLSMPFRGLLGFPKKAPLSSEVESW